MTSDNRSPLADAVAENQDNCVALLIRLIASKPQTFRSEGVRQAQAIVEQELRALRFETRHTSVDADAMRAHPLYVPVESRGPEEKYRTYSPVARPALVAQRIVDASLPTIIINGHIDVEVVDPDGWTFSPVGEVVDGRVYGRGAADTLGGIAALINALHAIERAGASTTCNVLVHIVPDEEIGGNGTLQCVVEGIRADAAILLEPTGLAVSNTTLGWHPFRVDCSGDTGHQAGTSGGGADATFVEARQRLLAGAASIASEISAYPQYGNQKLNPMVIDRFGGGEQRGNPAARAFLEGTAYAPPHWNRDELGQRLDAMINKPDPIAAQVTMSDVFFDGHVSPDTTALHAFRRAFTATGESMKLDGFPSPCDARLYASAGVPAVVFGPGHLAQAHGHDEYVDVAQLTGASQVLATVLTDTDAGWR